MTVSDTPEAQIAARMAALEGKCRVYESVAGDPVPMLLDAASLRFLLDRCEDLEREKAEQERHIADIRAVHLRRHLRLAEALRVDPGYSVDATIGKAIDTIDEVARQRDDLRARVAALSEDAADLDWLEAQRPFGNVADVFLSVLSQPVRAAIRAARSAAPEGATEGR